MTKFYWNVINSTYQQHDLERIRYKYISGQLKFQVRSGTESMSVTHYDLDKSLMMYHQSTSSFVYSLKTKKEKLVFSFGRN